MNDLTKGERQPGRELIQKAVPEIEPGCAVVFYGNEADRMEAERSINEGMAWLRRGREVFDIETRWERTDDERLANRIVARRVNVGCADRYAVIVGESGNMRLFLERYFDLTDTSAEEVLIVGNAESSLFEPEDSAFQKVSEEQTRYLSREEAEIERIEGETRIFLEEVSRLIRDYVSKTHRMPPMAEIERIVRGNLSLEKEKLSPLVIDRDLRILLPAYGNLELPLQPLSKALYFLFLLHPEGICLAEIASHKRELEELYSIIMPNRDEGLARQSIEMLVSPLRTESLRQQISRIKRIVTAKVLGPEIAAQYYISGERGTIYRIPLSRDMVSLPKILEM